MMTLCECGCGQPAPIAHQTDRAQGYVKGEPRRFVKGHHRRVQPCSKETRERIAATKRGERNPNWKASSGLNETHTALRRAHPKRGRCEQCGREGRTDYAFLRHPEPYTRERADYVELCRSCHTAYDNRRHDQLGRFA